MQKTVLLTGGTGAFGKYLIRRLLAHEDVHLILLVRATTDYEARRRIMEHGVIPDAVEVIAADLCTSRLGISETAYNNLQNRVTHVLHAAGATRFNAPLDQARLNNVDTTREMLDSARHFTHLKRFAFVSTAMVAGKRIGTIYENELAHDAGFTNAYQQAKYEAEMLVRDTQLPTVVFRPPFIYAPEEIQNRTKATSFLPLLIALVANGQLPFTLGTPESPMDIVSEPDASRAIVALLLKESLSYDTYHISNGLNAITIGEFHHIIEELRQTTIPVSYCGNAEEGIATLHRMLATAPRELQELYKRAESYLTEPAYPKIFDNAHTCNELETKMLGEDPAHVLKTAVQRTLWSSST